MLIEVCNVELFSSTRAKGFKIDGLHFLIVEDDGELNAFVNRCPHQGVPLDWDNDQFLDIDEEFIQCATHGAIFDIQSGLCRSGPCVGQSLVRVPITVQAETVYIDPDDVRLVAKTKY